MNDDSVGIWTQRERKEEACQIGNIQIDSQLTVHILMGGNKKHTPTYLIDRCFQPKSSPFLNPNYFLF